MKILTLNCGSSSLKFDVIHTTIEKMQRNEDSSLVRGIIEKIGSNEAIVRFKTHHGHDSKVKMPVNDHKEALKKIIEILTGDNPKILSSLEEIAGVGHRVVHGGETFTKSVVIDSAVKEEIVACSDFAPLHNPQNLIGIQVASEFFPHIPHVAVFDTGFHHTMPNYSYIYPLPYNIYQKHRIRRYGFHGSSHRFVSKQAAELLGIPSEKSKLITAHLGNGCSITAIRGGRSVDTSMGHTPLEGLMMGTRCGDIDPALILHIMNKEGLSIAEADAMMNKKSGLLGISQLSNDLREIEDARDKGHEMATLALDIFCYRLKKYISSYMGVLGGADALVFTGGIGENSCIVRELATKDLDFMGIKIDQSKNTMNNGVLGKYERPTDISASDAKVKTLVVPTNEELVIARDTVLCIEKLL
ncbi:MAG: acetate kinase [Oligoflexia bacterium]|nr:acetate kinase [Oligoflexia bacterium]MBF0366544.1 acetate kinase [Oligoflexia bacterium]